MTEEKIVSSKEETVAKKPKTGLIIGIIAAILVVAAVIFCAIFYGGKSGLVGKYELYAYIKDGKESTETVEFMKSLGMNMTAEFKEDKTGTMQYTSDTKETDTNADTINFTYTSKMITIKAEDSEDGESTETAQIKHDGEYVTITIGEEEMKFKKVTE